MASGTAELRGEEGQQRHLALARVADAQLLLATVEGKRACREGLATGGRLELAFTFGNLQHQVGATVAVRRERLACGEADQPHLRLIPLQQ
jgi:hypothetical protein